MKDKWRAVINEVDNAAMRRAVENSYRLGALEMQRRAAAVVVDDLGAPIMLKIERLIRQLETIEEAPNWDAIIESAFRNEGPAWETPGTEQHRDAG